jgi:DNA-binding NtrC family response regulator
MNTPSFIFLPSEVVVLLAYPPGNLWEADFVKEILEPEGFCFFCVENLADLVSIYEERREGIDLVVVLTYDLTGTKAPAVLDALQTIHQGVRCAFITGVCSQMKMDELVTKGAVGVLPKPYRSEDLLATMRHWSQR